MTKYLSNYIINAAKKGNLKAVQRYLTVHKNNEEWLNASEEHKVGVGLFTVGDVSGWNKDRLTHLAIRSGQMTILAALAACDGIDVNAVNRDFVSPLQLAVSYRNVEAVKILLSNPRLKVDAVDYNEDTALLMAARVGNLEIIKMLLEHGADKNHKNHLGYDAAKEAFSFGHQACMDFIVAFQSQAPEVITSKSYASTRQ